MKRLIFIALTLSLYSGCKNLSIETNQKIYNIEDFGAKGDGFYDNYLSFKKAINQLNKAGAGQINFPAGTFIINLPKNENESTYTFSNLANLTLTGDKTRETVLIVRKSLITQTGLLFRIRNCSNVKISNLTIQGGK